MTIKPLLDKVVLKVEGQHLRAIGTGSLDVALKSDLVKLSLTNGHVIPDGRIGGIGMIALEHGVEADRLALIGDKAPSILGHHRPDGHITAPGGSGGPIVDELHASKGNAMMNNTDHIILLAIKEEHIVALAIDHTLEMIDGTDALVFLPNLVD